MINPTYVVLKRTWHFFVKNYIIVILLLNSYNSFTQQLAFPTAKGAGAQVTGGRCGIILKVTNLNNSGPGSLRSALTASGPRIIVFDVSGTIVLTTMIELGIANSNFTVAGQTAPEGGITIAGRPIQMGGGWGLSPQGCHNAIWRFVRFRNGSYTGGSDNYMHNGLITTGTNGLIIDHCSFSFCDDQAISMNADWTELRNITIQNSVFSENATGVIGGWSLVNPSGDMTFVNNLFVDQGHRTPNLGGNLRFDIINNVYFNWSSRLTNINRGNPQVNYVGNYLKPGSSTSIAGGVNKVQNVIPTIYTANNFHPNFYPQPQLNDTFLWQNFFNTNALPSSYFTDALMPMLGVDFEIKSASETYETVLNDVGANKFLTADGSSGFYLDSFDALKIGNVINNVSSNPFNKQWTLPNIPNTTRPTNYDTNNDGMPDVWKISKGFQADTDLSNYVWPSGYIGIEEFLNEIDNPNSSATTITPNQTICQGETTTLAASGGASYQWSSGQTTASITVSPQETSTYSVQIILENGDIETLETIVAVNPIPEANAGDNQSICQGDTITLTALGGTSYLWSNGATTQSITVNPTTTTTYTVEVTENNCSSTDEVTVTVNSIPTVNAGNDVTIAAGQSVNLTATGAATYAWNTGETGAEITVSPTETTTYIVAGTSNGCSAEDEVTVFVAGNIAAQVSEDQTICNGESITLTASGGDNFLWSNGETTASITLNPTQTTTYSVEVSDNFGNSDMAEVTVFVNPIPNASAGDNQSICQGDTITLTASGGISYLWSNGASTQSITVNPTTTTTYTVEVTENDCSSTDEVTVTVNSIPTVNAGNDVTIAAGQSVNLTATGAATYAWNTGETGAAITVAPTETTTYTVTGNSNGCSAQDEVTVFVTGNIAAQVSDDQTICNGESITLTASGGDNFLWSNGETTASITVNPTQTTTYSVEVLDNFGNSDMAEVTVFVNPIPNANAGDNQSICQGDTITLTASGGASYLWSNGATTQSITVNPTATTTYTVEVTENDCSSTDEVTVTVNPIPELQISGETTIFYGNSTTLTVNGADSYLWSNGATSYTITVQPEQTTTYEVTGYLNGCSSSQSVTIIVENHIEAFAGEDQRICQGYEVTLTASGGSSYLWNTGETTQSITVSPTSNSTYSVTVFDGPYQDEASVNVFVDPNPNVTIVNGSEATILEGNFITLSATGANSYQWNNGATQPNIAVSPSATTIYRVTGFINDCSDEKEITVNVLERVVANAGNDVTICPQETATLTATGGDDYLWSTGETTQSIEVAPEETTLYTVTVFNELDFDEATVMVVVEQQCQTVILPDDEEDTTFAFQVYPNPVSETLFIQLNGVINMSNLKMFDVAGKLLFSEILEQTNQPYNFEKQIDVTNFQTGLYFVRLEDELRVITKKILIQ